MLNATWLETFTMLCEIGHFTKTADRLGMTQPGVSQHLQKLEGQVGKPLISRDGKSFHLTAVGEAVFNVGIDRRAQERDLHDAILTDGPDTGPVNIGCSGSFAMWLYPHLLKRMQVAPGLTIGLTAAPHATIVQGVLDAEFDLGITAQSIDHLKLAAKRIAREELCLVVPSSHAGRNFDLDALNELGFIAHPDGPAYADALLGLNFSKTYKGAQQLRCRASVNQIGQIPMPVAHGMGYTILPQSGVDAFAGKDDLAIINLPQRQYRDLWIACQKGRTDLARVAAMADLIAEKSVSLG